MSDPLSKARAFKQQEKERMKAQETPEEKRLRRITKKASKESKRKEAMGWEEGYTNRDNPFGDSNLEATFVWRKKYSALGVTDIDEKEIERINKARLEETKKELEQVKKRRLEREKEREQRMTEMDSVQRDREMVNHQVWERQEDTFHLKQAKLRSRIRLKGGRAKPIDIIGRYIDAFGDKDPDAPPPTEDEKEDEESYLMTAHITEPYKCLNGLRRSDLEDLVEDIKVYQELDKGRNSGFWTDLQVIVDDELAKLKKYKSSAARGAQERREGINKAVASEVTAMFENKSPSELSGLKKSIEKKIASGDEGIDFSYWETLLSKLKAFIARARLREQHQVNMGTRLERLNLLAPNSNTDAKEDAKNEKDAKNQESDAKDKSDLEIEIKTEPTDGEPTPGCSKDADEDQSIKIGAEVPTEAEEPEGEEEEEEQRLPYELVLLRQCQDEYEKGRYSPPLLTTGSHQSDAHPAIEPEEDDRIIAQLRARILFPKSANVAPMASASTSGPGSLISSGNQLLNSADSAFEREARKGMDKDEVQFSVEETIVQGRGVASWADKYKPRKPRYFNRVHTGFEWNKYNQTHYDVDNPPPKIVQGYKFNLFYPDLIDKSATPIYKITPCSDNRDFSVIRFSAGPPYEDIAFKIVNREWNYSYKSGFRSQFSNNILQLWFHFKRYRYRR